MIITGFGFNQPCYIHTDKDGFIRCNNNINLEEDGNQIWEKLKKIKGKETCSYKVPISKNN